MACPSKAVRVGVNSEVWRNWRPVDAQQFFATSLADGAPLRPPLSLRHALAFGTCVGVASGVDARHRENAWHVLMTAVQRFEQQCIRSPHEAAWAFEAAFDGAADQVFGNAGPAEAWGVCAAVLMPRWDVFCYARRGAAALWRRQRRGEVRAIVHGPAPSGAPDPLVMLGFGDRLLLAAGSVTGLEREAFGQAIGSLGGGGAAGGGVVQLAIEHDRAGSASALLVTMPAGGQAVRAAGRSGGIASGPASSLPQCVAAK